MGWISTNRESIYKFSHLHGRTVHAVASCLKQYPNHRVISYEALCADPVAHFRSLYEFAGLRWTPTVEDRTREHSRQDDSKNPYGTYRNSSSKATAWLNEITREDLNTVREGYLAAGSDWYRDEADWQVAS